jgi:vitamin B12 transporter
MVRAVRYAARAALALSFAAVPMGVATPAWAQQPAASIVGTVVDPLGARVAGAMVTLTRDGKRAAETVSDDRGEFSVGPVEAARYQIAVTAAGFERHVTAPFYAGHGRTAVDVPLQIGALTQDVVVSAAATELPQSQVGAQVTVIDHAALDRLGKVDVLEAIRTAPGLQVVQVGARGGATSLFVRGGNSNFNKVLIDGVPANDIGGGVDLGQFATTGVERVEVLREANSVLYGSDALTGVVSISTRRGQTRVPELSASLDAGALGTDHEDVALGGVVQRLDYFADVSRFKTDNSTPNNAFRNKTFASRVGMAVGNATSISATLRRVSTEYGVPNGFTLFGIADDSSQSTDLTFASVSADSQLSERWRSTIRVAWMDRAYHNVNPTPTGTPSGGNYLGQLVTLTGANGYSVTGRAILDFGGTTYPSPFDSGTTRGTWLGQTSFHVSRALDLSGGVRVENERGFTLSASRSASDRTNEGAFVEARASLNRAYVNGGVGIDRNAIFGTAVTPRLSAAVYLRSPSSMTAWGDTKLMFNAGTGIKAPGISQELSSLFAVLQPLPQGPGLIASSGVSPIGPERSRSVDVGLEQSLWRGHGRVRATYFNNTFEDLIEFVSKTVLPQAGVPAAVAAALPGGAYVNSQSFRARGLETSAEVEVIHQLRVLASYTYLDALVTQSFASGALQPAINPAFPGVAIGAFSPLVGARPFRRPANSGTLVATYVQGPAQVTIAGSFVGKADDSTFLSDSSFGNSMLLPNRDLDAAYQKIDLSASYRFQPRLRGYLSIENIANQSYEAAFGFPALPRSARIGLTVTLGGDRP